MYTEYSIPKPKFQSVSLYDQPFSRYRLVKNRNAPNDPRMTLITEVSKVPCVHWILTPDAQISLCFALRSLVSHIIEVFCFPIGCNGEIKKIVKNRKLKNFKNPKQYFLWGQLRRKFRKRLKRFKSDLREEQRFQVLAPIGSHMLTKTKKIIFRKKIKNCFQ